jgi:hypothetical protein
MAGCRYCVRPYCRRILYKHTKQESAHLDLALAAEIVAREKQERLPRSHYGLRGGPLRAGG